MCWCSVGLYLFLVLVFVVLIFRLRLEAEVLLGVLRRAVHQLGLSELEPLVVVVKDGDRDLGPHVRAGDVVCAVVADEALEGSGLLD